MVTRFRNHPDRSTTNGGISTSAGTVEWPMGGRPVEPTSLGRLRSSPRQDHRDRSVSYDNPLLKLRRARGGGPRTGPERGPTTPVRSLSQRVGPPHLPTPEKFRTLVGRLRDGSLAPSEERDLRFALEGVLERSGGQSQAATNLLGQLMATNSMNPYRAPRRWRP